MDACETHRELATCTHDTYTDSFHSPSSCNFPELGSVTWRHGKGSWERNHTGCRAEDGAGYVSQPTRYICSALRIPLQQTAADRTLTAITLAGGTLQEAIKGAPTTLPAKIVR